MTSMIQHRESFLANIAKQLGRSPNTELPRPTWQYQPQDRVLKEATQDELVEVLIKQCANIHTDIKISSTSTLPQDLQAIVDHYGGQSVITWKDERLKDYGLSPLMTEQWPQANIELYEWNAQQPEENIRQAEKANIGITISEMTLAESGTAVLFSSKNRGRSVSFLPEKSIILIPKSTIVPRMTQAARWISEKIRRGDNIPSCINFITGPSNSADIEMILIVGVHGPVQATYLVIEDR
ncbi:MULTISPECIES: lactate utilization protein C [unclassified Lysinibacillus]|uniref:LutC/YkgG family protein n=1 Tax=unclassified Lysinibacillus TaxID=2636778 RepID=UPI000883BD0E|nr:MULTISPECIES: lactate utilization protein C [unclassified Lysinibacillus]SCY19663.1 L-lactate dehydrogenase complex protein LldG [Lysinibacillus sp. SG9]SDB10335.1 L-lactate dehydrogenase complex protein LldG [Lysinibacillus sp. TC-37]SFS46628.1 L-lactate dehydrogenase complex protein LldG [Lysinibacillus sp. SG55]